jgi:hypothetical protein
VAGKVAADQILCALLNWPHCGCWLLAHRANGAFTNVEATGKVFRFLALAPKSPCNEGPGVAARKRLTLQQLALSESICLVSPSGQLDGDLVNWLTKHNPDDG